MAWVPCEAQQLQQAPKATGGVLGRPEFRQPAKDRELAAPVLWSVTEGR
jgi:hypothetical protein